MVIMLQQQGLHAVEYDDGDSEVLHLDKEDWRLAVSSDGGGGADFCSAGGGGLGGVDAMGVVQYFAGAPEQVGLRYLNAEYVSLIQLLALVLCFFFLLDLSCLK